MVIVESLLVKGLIGLGKVIVAHGATAKVGLILMKAVGAYGLSGTITSVMLVGIAAGGIFWTRDRVNNLKNGLKAIEEGDMGKAAMSFAILAMSSHIGVEMLPDAVHDYLVKLPNVSEEKATDVAKLINEMENDIGTQMMKLK